MEIEKTTPDPFDGQKITFTFQNPSQPTMSSSVNGTIKKLPPTKSSHNVRNYGVDFWGDIDPSDPDSLRTIQTRKTLFRSKLLGVHFSTDSSDNNDLIQHVETVEGKHFCDQEQRSTYSNGLAEAASLSCDDDIVAPVLERIQSALQTYMTRLLDRNLFPHKGTSEKIPNNDGLFQFETFEVLGETSVTPQPPTPEISFRPEEGSGATEVPSDTIIPGKLEELRKEKGISTEKAIERGGRSH